MISISDNTIKKVYLSQNKDTRIQKNSSSGGIFYAIAKYFISGLNGVVYGAKYDHELNVVHDRATTISMVEKFMGSKYVQSDCTDIYVQVKNDLLAGRYVLFSGTPCQVMAIKQYVGNGLQDKLFLVDFICHGVASERVYNDYRHYMEKKYHSKIEKISFRGKKIKNEIQDMYILFSSGKQYLSYGTHDYYYNFFLRDLILRPSCYSCKFASKRRISDVTLSDYWGTNRQIIKKYHRNVSCIYINSEKGNVIFEAIKDDLLFEESTNEICDQRNLHGPTSKPKDKDEVMKYYLDNGFDKTIVMLCGNPLIFSIKRMTKLVLNKLGILSMIHYLKGIK